MPLNHETVTANHPVTGKPVELDKGILILILELWRRDIKTNFSCEGSEKVRGYISFPSHDDIDKFLRALLPLVTDDEMKIRIGDKVGKVPWEQRWQWGWHPAAVRGGESYQVYMWHEDVTRVTGLLIADAIGWKVHEDA